MLPTSASRKRSLVIGAGVIGHACALRLQAIGHEVVLTDPDADRIGPSWGNAGHIATEQVAPLAAHLREHGVLALVGERLRLVTHLDVDAAQIERALDVFRRHFQP